MQNQLIGPYRVLAPLGTGGMGEVWRAEDTRLGREVAIKLLPEAFVESAERLARFEREARVLASLNHPNIAHLYGLETSPPVGVNEHRTSCLVMELVEGEGLDEVLARGPLPVADAIAVARQIAAGLEAAHDAGIVHRDLKPANVRIRPDGAVKVLDFGLAKAWEGDPGQVSLSLSPTMTRQATAAGVILGTAAYMSPEQARGRPVDRRADIWAFGVVLWEMLTGRTLFRGETVSDVLAEVLKSEIDLAAVPADTPPPVRRLLRRCLARDQHQRLHDMADVRLELEDAASARADPPPASHMAPASRRARLLLATLAAALVASAGANLLLVRSRPASGPTTPVQLSIPLPDGARIVAPRTLPLGLGQPAVAISRDGKTVVCAVETDGVSRLFRRRLDEPEGVLLAGTEGAYNPSFSPSGEWLAFGAGSLLKRIRSDGSGVTTIHEVANIRGVAWLSEGELLVAGAEGADLLRIDVEAGTARRVPEQDLDRRCTYPVPIPGHDQVVASNRRGHGSSPDAAAVEILSLSDWTTRELAATGVSPRILPSGYLLVARAAELLAAPFDLVQLELRGRFQPVGRGVLTEARGIAQYDVSDTGTLVYVPGGSLAVAELVWVDRAGSVEPLGFEPQVFGDFQLSPDGTRLAVTVALNLNQVWIYDLERRSRRRLSGDDGGQNPIWDPAGDRVAYAVRAGGATRVVVQDVDGASEVHDVPGSDGMTPYAWTTADGLVASTEDDAIAAVDPTGEQGPRVLVDTPEATDWGASVSPDGRWIAYTSDASGRYEVYARPLHGQGRTWTLSNDGGEEPIWSADGTALVYRNGDHWYLVSIGGGAELRPGVPTPIVAGPYTNVGGRSFDLADDPSRLLLLRPVAGQDRPTRVDVVLNWLPEVERQLAPRS